jgi:hypothetical protein
MACDCSQPDSNSTGQQEDTNHIAAVLPLLHQDVHPADAILLSQAMAWSKQRGWRCHRLSDLRSTDFLSGQTAIASKLVSAFDCCYFVIFSRTKHTGGGAMVCDATLSSFEPLVQVSTAAAEGSGSDEKRSG